MADEIGDEAKSDAKGAGKRGRLKGIIIVGALMLVEGVGVFALVKLVSPAPETVSAEDKAAAEDPFNLSGEVELIMCEISTFNRKEGRLYVYNAEISVLVAAEDQERIERFVEVRSLSIKDRIQVVFRSADPKDLNDPSLDTIKRQVQFELNNLLGGKELIREVLISKLLQSRANL